MNKPKMRIWVTEYATPQGDQMGSTIAGATWDEAQHGCDCRGLGEKVIGELGGVIEDTPDGPIIYEGTTDEDDPEQPARRCRVTCTCDRNYVDDDEHRPWCGGPPPKEQAGASSPSERGAGDAVNAQGAGTPAEPPATASPETGRTGSQPSLPSGGAE